MYLNSFSLSLYSTCTCTCTCTCRCTLCDKHDQRNHTNTIRNISTSVDIVHCPGINFHWSTSKALLFP